MELIPLFSYLLKNTRFRNWRRVWLPTCQASRTALKFFGNGEPEQELKTWFRSIALSQCCTRSWKYPLIQKLKETKWVHSAGFGKRSNFLTLVFFFPPKIKKNKGLSFHWTQKDVWNLSCLLPSRTLKLHLCVPFTNQSVSTTVWALRMTLSRKYFLGIVVKITECCLQ